MLHGETHKYWTLLYYRFQQRYLKLRSRKKSCTWLMYSEFYLICRCFQFVIFINTEVMIVMITTYLLINVNLFNIWVGIFCPLKSSFFPLEMVNLQSPYMFMLETQNIKTHVCSFLFPYHRRTYNFDVFYLPYQIFILFISHIHIGAS